MLRVVLASSVVGFLVTGCGGAGGTSAGGGEASWASASGALDSTIVIDSITSPVASGSYRAGASIPVIVGFTGAIYLSGTSPQLQVTLNNAKTLSVTPTNGTSVATFAYTVAAADGNVPDLTVTAIGLTGTNAAIRDAQGDTIVLTLPVGANLGDSKDIRIDTVAPAAPPPPALVPGSDLGRFSMDGTTSVTRPGFRLNAAVLEPGDTLQLLNATAVLGSAVLTADDVSNGYVEIEPTAPLAQGTYPGINAKAIDRAGNPSPASPNALPAIVIDTSPPAAPTALDLAAADDLGTSATDNVTTATTNLSFTGSVGESNTLVNVFVDGTLSGAATVTGTTWSYELAGPLAATPHAITAQATDLAGNVSSSSTALQVTIDTAPPTVASFTTTLASSSYRAAAVIPITLTFNEGVYITGTGAALQLTLNNGRTATATPAAGAQAVVFSYTVGAADTNTPDLTVTALALTGSGAALRDAAGNPANLALPTGTNLADSKDIRIDTLPPSMPSAPDMVAGSDTGQSDQDNTTSTLQPIFRVSFSALEVGDSVLLYTGTTLLGSTVLTAAHIAAGSVEVVPTVNFAAGNHPAVNARSSDIAGNLSAAGNNTIPAVVIDATAPAAPTALDLAAADDTGTSATDNITSATTGLTVSGAVAEPLMRVEFFVDGTSGGLATVTGTAWTYDIPGALATGVRALVARAIDVAGNVSAASTTLNVTIDTNAPGITSLNTAVADGSYNAGDVIPIIVTFSEGLFLTGTSANVQLTLNNGKALTVVPAAGASSATFSYTVAAADGNTPRLTATALSLNGTTPSLRDAAGNVAVLTLPTGTNLGDVKAIRIDTTAPAAPGMPDLVAASDTGASNEDNRTSNTRPAFSVSFTGLETGDWIQLYSTTTLLGTAVLTAADIARGSVEVSPTAALATGTYASINAKATDLAGNASAASANVTPAVVIDTAAPAAPAALDLAATDDSGTSNTDNVTNVTTGVTLSGTVAEAGLSVELFVDGTSVGPATVTATAWSLDIAGPLAEGARAITARATDAAGNTSVASAALTVTVDTTVPAISSITSTLASGSYRAATVIPVNVNFSEGIFLTGTSPGVLVTLSNGIVRSAVPAAAALLASVSYTVAAADANTPDLTVDGVTLSGTAPALRDRAGNAANLALPVGTNLGDQKDIRIDTAVPTTPAVPDLLAASDTGSSSTDNVTSATRPGFRVDISATSIEPGDTLQLLNATTVIASVAVSLADLVAGYVDLAPTAALAAGTHAINARIVDLAGNNSVASANLAPALVVDTGSPAAPAALDLAAADDTGFSATDNVTNAPTGLTISGTVAESGLRVELLVDDTSTGFATVTGTTFTVDIAGPLGDGAHTVKARSLDAAGNASALSATLGITVDTVAPTIASVTSTTVSGSYRTGAVIPVSLNFSQAVYLAGTSPLLQVTLSNGKLLTVAPAAGATVATVSYTVAAADTNTADLTVASVVLTGTGATLRDLAGNGANLALPVGSNLGDAKDIRIDTAPPGTPDVPDLLAASDAGLLDTDNLTNVTAPRFRVGLTSASAEPGDTLLLFNGTTQIGSVVLTSTDIVTNKYVDLAPTAALAGGTYLINARVSDLAGNLSTASSNLAPSLVVDVALPATPTATDLATADDTGTSTADNVTSQRANLSFAGTVVTEANLRTEVYLNGTRHGAATVAGAAWSYEIAGPLAEGTYLVTARSIDAAGNTSAASTALTLVLDSTGPTITGISSTTASGSYRAAVVIPITVTFSEGVYLGGTGPNVTITLNNAKVLTAVPAAGAVTATYAYTIAAADGNVADLDVGAVTLGGTLPTLRDLAGNSASLVLPTGANLADGRDLRVDTVAPLTPGVPDLTAASDSGYSPTDNITSVTRPSFSVSLPAGAEVGDALQLFNATTQVGQAILTAADVAAGSALVQPTAALAVNNYPGFNARLVDRAGNISPVSANATPPIQLDVTAPTGVVTGLDLAAVDDDGPSAVDDITSLRTGLSISGSVPAVGLFVTLFDDANRNGLYDTGEALVSDVLVGTSTFSFEIALADGVHSIRAFAADAAGNRTAFSSALTLNIRDTSAPSPPVISTSGYVNSLRPPVSGTSETGSTVRLYEGTTLLGTATTDAAGDWTVTPSAALSEGSHTLRATATDIYAQVSVYSATSTIIVDVTPPPTPGITGFSPDSGAAGDRLTYAAILTLTGRTQASATVSLYDSAVAIGTATADASGDWTFTTEALDDGEHVFTATLTDPAGNVATSTALAVVVDTTPPDAPGLDGFDPDTGSSGDGITRATILTFTGTAAAASTVTLHEGATSLGTTVADAAGNFSITSSPLAEGEHTVHATATDPAGNRSEISASIVVEIDATVPGVPTLTSIGEDTGNPSDGRTADDTVQVVGTAEAGARVRLSGTRLSVSSLLGEATADAAGDYSITTESLVEGSWALSLVATDVAGNDSSSRAVGIWVIDRTAPAPPSIVSTATDTGVAGDGITFDRSQLLSGTAEPFSVVTVSEAARGLVLGSPTADGTGAWTLDAGIELEEGEHVFTASSTDGAGNTSLVSAGFSLTIDTRPPGAPSIVSFDQDTGVAGDGLTNDSTLTLAGTSEPGARVSVLESARPLGVAVANGEGAWTFTTAALADGSLVFTARAADVAGNEGPLSEALTVRLDTGRPTAPTILAFADDSGTAGDRITSDTTLELSGVSEPGATVVLSDGPDVVATLAADGQGAWSVTTAALGDGLHTFTAIVTDVAGNASDRSAAFGVTVDTAAPAAPVLVSFSDDSGAAGDGTTNDTVLVLRGTSEPLAQVTVLDAGAELGTTTADAAGTWSFTTDSLADGARVFSARATDRAGNAGVASADLTVTVDATRPDAPAIQRFDDDSGTVGDGITSDLSLSFSGVAEAGATVEVSDGVSVLGTTQAGPGGAWTFDAPPLPEGTHVFTAVARDVAGNTSDRSGELGVLLRSNRPTLVLPGPQATPEDTPLAFTGAGAIVIGSHESPELDVELTVTHGVLVPGAVEGLSFLPGSGPGTRSVRFNAPVAAARAAVQGLVYEPDRDYSGGDTMVIRLTDSAETLTGDLELAVVPVDDSPVVEELAPVSTSSGRETSPVAIIVSDVDTSFEELRIAIRSSDASIVDAAGIAVGSTGSGWALVLTPVPARVGTATITVAVSDATNTVERTFVLTITEADADGDGLLDHVETAADLDDDGTPNFLDGDSDGDGIGDAADNCYAVANAAQLDTDDDRAGDACDDDRDGDGLSNDREASAGLDPLLTDSDGDGISDAAEFGPDETPRDTDGDGTIDAKDDDADGDGTTDLEEGRIDTDEDGTIDALDTDSDGDGVSDASDLCRVDDDPEQADLDADLTGDACDDDLDGDGLSNAREEAVRLDPRLKDSDGDGLEDGEEFGTDEEPRDSDDDETIDALDEDSDGDGVSDSIEGKQDTDTDGVIDALDTDSDADAIEDRTDNCRIVENPDQRDTDSDGEGDVCADDDDGDGVLDAVDTCPTLADPTQADADSDGQGDACDDDRDGDGAANGADNCPEAANADQADVDGDRLGDTCDPTDDRPVEPPPEGGCGCAGTSPLDVGLGSALGALLLRRRRMVRVA